jgi:glycosyltransferase involved in cell wall biosynthesis
VSNKPAEQDPPSILFISQYFSPETGAASNRVSELTKRWESAGHDVSVITSAPDYPEGELYDDYDNELHRVDSHDGVTVHTLATIPAGTETSLRRALKFIWFFFLSLGFGFWIASDTDIVIATSPQPLTGVSACLISTARRSKFVFDVRDLWPESISSVGRVENKFLLRTLQTTVEWVYRRADRIVVVSRAFKQPLVESGVDPAKIWYHPNGVDPSFATNVESATAIDEAIAEQIDGKFVVSYVGTVGRAHGLNVVLEAADQLSETAYDDVFFLVVGYGSEAERLRREATERGLDNVAFTGQRPKSMVPSILAATDISLVHLKPRDLFELTVPSKVFESMAAGLPIVLGVRGEAARIVTDGETGIPVEPGDGAAIGDAVRELHDDPDRRRRLGQNGKEYVCEHFSWDHLAEAYRERLGQLCGERPS